MADIGHLFLDSRSKDSAVYGSATDSSHTNFTKYLIATGKLSAPALERAERLAAEENRRLSLVLTGLGLIADRDLAASYAAYLDIPLLPSERMTTIEVYDGLFNTNFLKSFRILPIENTSDKIVIVMADPLDFEAIAAVRFATEKNVELCVASASDIETAYDQLYAESRVIDGPQIDPALHSDFSDGDLDRLRDGASEAPVIRLVNQIIARAVESRASDIHFEPTEDGLRIRYRIDGFLRDIERPPPQLRSALVSRLKIMGRLDIAERRLAQDGRVSLAIRGRDIDFRISTTPTMHGESVVLRILDRTDLTLELEPLGFTGTAFKSWTNALAQPHGIVLVTGPTGSGKTTTLYASLLSIADHSRKILTIEDPIEYQLPLINQTQIKPSIGLTFANALRSFLRQDPDIMMVGEIRDLETARIAVQAALTGHLILSTLHTNDAASALTRLLDMGVEDYLMTSTINAIAAQRLVRRLCISCRESDPALPELADRLKINQGTFYRAVGCPACNGSGYRGRTAVVEVLPMSDEIRRLVLNRNQAADIQRAAEAEGMQSLQKHGIELASAGLTSLSEIFRISGQA